MMFRSCYEHSHSIPEAQEKLKNWYKKVDEKQIDSFITAKESIRLHETTILNYCNYSGRHHLDATNKMILYPLPHKSIEKKFFLLDSD